LATKQEKKVKFYFHPIENPFSVVYLLSLNLQLVNKFMAKERKRPNVSLGNPALAFIIEIEDAYIGITVYLENCS
jgi:hypothetical protein